MYTAVLCVCALLCCTGRCDVVTPPGSDKGSCNESSWLRDELLTLRRLVQEQRDTSDQLSSAISRQLDTMARLHIQVTALEAAIDTVRETSENMFRHLQNGVDFLIEKRGENTAILAHDSVSFSEPRNPLPRSDDEGPLEAVVSQMGQQVNAMEATIQALTHSDRQQDQNIQDGRTSTFVHWGSSQCPSGSQLVYSGVVGGSYFSHSGSGTNYLCLTMSPVFGTHSMSGPFAQLFGAEYETQTDQHHNMDAVCAVCRASQATTIMIPGTNVCTQGWTKQYDGYLMAEREDYNAAQYICVDSMMEGRPGTQANQDGSLLFFTVAQCGSLPCEPYANNGLLTCVVCSL